MSNREKARVRKFDENFDCLVSVFSTVGQGEYEMRMRRFELRESPPPPISDDVDLLTLWRNEVLDSAKGGVKSQRGKVKDGNGKTDEEHFSSPSSQSSQFDEIRGLHRASKH